MKEKITILIDGEMTTHIAGGVPEYKTLCGLDGDDPAIGMTTVETPRGQKIDCVACREIWLESKKWRKSDFSAGGEG